MSVLQYDQQRDAVPIRVRYEGTEMVPPGAAMCFNRTAGTAAEADDRRNFEVQKPATANLAAFAGIVTGASGGRQGPGWFDVVPLTGRGVAVNALTSADMTINVTNLGPVNDEWHLAASSTFRVARALQTANTSAAAGTAQVLLGGLGQGVGTNDA